MMSADRFLCPFFQTLSPEARREKKERKEGRQEDKKAKQGRVSAMVSDSDLTEKHIMGRLVSSKTFNVESATVFSIYSELVNAVRDVIVVVTAAVAAAAARAPVTDAAYVNVRPVLSARERQHKPSGIISSFSLSPPSACFVT